MCGWRLGWSVPTSRDTTEDGRYWMPRPRNPAHIQACSPLDPPLWRPSRREQTASELLIYDTAAILSNSYCADCAIQ